MITSLPYIIESQICFAILWMAYRLFISTGREFRISRFYLLGSVALSFIIPLLAIPVFRAPEQGVFHVEDIHPVFYFTDMDAELAAGIDWMGSLLMVAIAGSLIYAAVMVCGLFRLWQLKRSSIRV